MSHAHDSDALLTHLFVLRLWRETADAPWRAVLRSADGGERLVFADMEQLTLFLLSALDASTEVNMKIVPPSETD